jgi:exodeoxyribonuclease-5
MTDIEEFKSSLQEPEIKEETVEPSKQTPPIELFPEQQAAKDMFQEWYATVSTGIFRIFGYAGVGKTTTIRSIVSEVTGLVYYGAYTGKAALVMQRQGLPNARTIHSLIYKPIFPSKARDKELSKKLTKAREAGEHDEALKIEDKIKHNRAIHFEINEESPLLQADLLVLDEVSMVNQEMLDDLLYFNVPMLVLGDPGQLPPIKGEGALTRAKPDVMLDKIHRQAMDNPIINLSFRARMGKNIPREEFRSENHPTSVHKSSTGLTKEDALGADQILCGKNKTRRMLNRRYRKIAGFEGLTPMPGEKLICLKNSVGLFNGMMVTVKKIVQEYETWIQMELETEEGKLLHCSVLRAHFDEYEQPGLVKSLHWWDKQHRDEFDFGYAITVHKAQGSQWDHVVFWDDRFLVWDQKERRRWLYTGITRAVEQLTLLS